MQQFWGQTLKSFDMAQYETVSFDYVCKGSRQKKVHPLVAGPLRGGGGKGRAIKEKKNFFWNFFFILLPFKNTLDNLSKYGHITLKFGR